MKKLNKGFTLIELLIYTALIAIFITGAITFALNIIQGRQKATIQTIVGQEARSIMARISYEINNAQTVVSLSANQLVLDNTGSTTTIELAGNTINLTTAGQGPFALTSNQVRVTNLTFTNNGSLDSSTKSVRVNLTIEQLNTNTSKTFEASSSLESLVELNSQLNHSRQLLVDLGSLSLSANQRSIENITLQNTGTANVIIDQIYLSWTPDSGQNLTSFQINAGTEEWSGSAVSGSTTDITNFILAAGSGIISLDYLTFSSAIDSSTITLNFILSDGSTTTTLFTTGGVKPPPAPTPTLTPTPPPPPTATPTPAPASCAEVCTQSSYSTGTCRKNAATCNKNGETYVSTGNVFCTGGKNADTCCCLP